MVVYPNGLTCNVSQRRADAYERIAPPAAMALTFAGWGGLAPVWFSAAHPGMSVIAGMGVLVAMAALSMAVSFAVFQVWCRPEGLAIAEANGTELSSDAGQGNPTQSG